MSHLMDYGPDWPPRPPSAPRPRVFGRAFFTRAALIVTAFVVMAAMAIATDRPAGLDFPITGSTTSPTVASTPQSHHRANR